MDGGGPQENYEEASMDVLVDYDAAEGDDLFRSEETFNSNDVEMGEKDALEDNVEFITIENATLDIDNVVSTYTSNALLLRLMYIADTCPPLRLDAYRAALEYIMKNTQNTCLYHRIYHKVDKLRTEGVDVSSFPPISQEWAEQTAHKANVRLDALNSELRRQKDEGVKESIRRAMDDVFHQFMAMGSIGEALKLFSRGVRDFCTSPNFLIQMLLNWINATVYADQWTKLSVLLPQIERAISETSEREASASSQPGQRTGTLYHMQQRTAKNFKELIVSSKAKVAAVTGLANMKSGYYLMAADKFLMIDIDALNYPEMLSSGDIAIYGVLCALATYSRSALKQRVLGSSSFRKFIDSEPRLLDLLQKFCRDEFGNCLDILSEIKDQLMLNLYLAPHITDLYACIRRRAIVQFAIPYLRADLQSMAAVFRTTVDDLTFELFELIRSGELDARIDSYNNVLEKKITDKGVSVYQKSLLVNKDMMETANSFLLRAAFHQQGCVVGLQEGGNRRKRDFIEHMPNASAEENRRNDRSSVDREAPRS